MRERERERVPGDAAVDGAAFTGGTGRHFADAFLRRTSSLFLRFLQSSSVHKQLIFRNHRRLSAASSTATAAAGFRFQPRIRRRRSHSHYKTLTLGEREIVCVSQSGYDLFERESERERFWVKEEGRTTGKEERRRVWVCWGIILRKWP